MQDNEELIHAFVEEAREHLPLIEANLLRLEQQPDDPALLNGLFRSVHTIKGGAGFFGLKNIGELTHSMESLLSLARARKLLLARPHIDILLNCQDLLARMIADPARSNDIDVGAECRELDHLIATPKTARPAPPRPEPVPPPAALQPPLAAFLAEARDYVPQIESCLTALSTNPDNGPQRDILLYSVQALREGATSLELAKLAALAEQMEEVLGLVRLGQLPLDRSALQALGAACDQLAPLLARPGADIDIGPVCRGLLALGQGESGPAVPPGPPPAPIQAAPMATEPPSPPQLEADETIRVHVKRLNKLIDLAGELVLVRNQMSRLCEAMIPQVTGLKATLHNLNRITTEMQEEIMGTRMQPIGVIFNKFPRLIRQLEKDLGKRLELVTEGADVELDKTIIESLSDPATHIIRNMADHGIESPEERLQKGKPAIGTLVQKAFHESGHVVIQFSDDGAGIDPEFIAAQALQKQIVTAETLARMGIKDKMNLIFTPGFSTAPTLSAVSGRGIGMDVVKTNIEQIGGTVDIHSEPGKWTSLTLTLPLTMAIISALIVRARACRFAFPQGHLEEMVLLQPENYAKRVGQAHGQRMLSLRGDVLPLISLARSLGMDDTGENRVSPPEKPLHILIIKADGHRIAVIVDQILGSEEIVVKPMPEYFRHLKNFSGTSILGDGAIAMIIDVQGYIQRSRLAYSEVLKTIDSRPEHKIDQEPQSLLIFDNYTEERFALALSWIQRIDTIELGRIQNSAGHEYIEYHGEQMRLLRLEHCLPVQAPSGIRETAYIIIPKQTKVPVALLIDRVIDSKNIVVKLENTGLKLPGVLGSMILDGRITLILDLHAILKSGLPESVETVDINPERANSKHILLVEDTPFFMRVTREFIVASGYQVTTAQNGREGLELLNQQDFDLVLSDIEMPVMDGRDMLKNIRANPRWRDLPVIALTTLSDAQTIQEGKKSGFNEWLVKLDKELVLKTLAHYL
ncbi:two-component system, chemotaxis family, sensor kinase CheA [Methylomagnum ishizawai]|uniref:Chemotaxis protein CheA n=1 Tax=Methylomagnum ishizawai TaxID=1760988 RepID=A0A1Y6D5G8_9GAMM|nr:chemotaxis protein CheW [Methylomagnum ishizawai]SMF97680.1 two-component system, chemotaxis family, sensor kinase CheA [Methylomagnum ishizawai]